MLRAIPLHAAVAVLAIAACGSPPLPPPPPGSPEALVAYLQTVAGTDAATRQREVASWQVPAALWDRTVIAPYRPLHTDYQRAFTAELPALVARLAGGGTVTARRHYAGDPRLTRSQGRDRWALPPLFPSLVAEAGGAPIEAVFATAALRTDRDQLAHVCRLAETLCGKGSP